MMRAFLIHAALIGSVLWGETVAAQNINSLEARIGRMEREMQTLSRSVFKGDVPPPSLPVQNTQNQTAATEIRLNQLEDQLRRLTGLIEENGYRLRKLEEKMAQQQPVAHNPSPVAPIAPSVPQASETVPNSPYQLGTIQNNNNTATPAGLYDQAFSYLQVNDYASAQATFDTFLATYPDHSLAVNAKYWLGETYFARNDYAAASQAFAKSFKDHPDGSKAADTLLKLAMSLHKQNMKNEACLTLSELQKRFADAPASITDKAASEKKAYGCDG